MTLQRFAKIISMFPLVLLVGLMSGCSGKGPESTAQLAVQGLLSGGLSADARFAAIGSIHHGGSLWDVSRKERLFDWNHGAGEKSLIRAAGVSGDGKTAATAVDDAIVVWDTANGASKGFWKAPGRVVAMKLSGDGRRALLGLNNHQAIYFDLVAGGQIHRFDHTLEVRGVDMDESGTVAITGSDDGDAKLWSLEDGRLLHTISLNNQIKTVAMSPDGSVAFATAQREDAVVVVVSSGKVKTRLPNRYTNFTAARFDNAGRQLLLGTFQGSIHLIDANTGSETSKWQAKPRKAYGGSSSKAIVDVTFGAGRKGAVALTSDGLLQKFQ